MIAGNDGQPRHIVVEPDRALGVEVEGAAKTACHAHGMIDASGDPPPGPGGVHPLELSVVALVALYYVAPVPDQRSSAIIVRVAVASALVALVVIWQVRSVTRSDRPRLRAVEGLSVTVTLMVVLFATAYVTMSDWDQMAFSEPLGRTGALYFTLTTLTTVGFGDIVARTDAARIAVMVQMVFNVAVLGLVVRLILNAARQRMRDNTPS